jgi:hypothetical protein
VLERLQEFAREHISGEVLLVVAVLSVLAFLLGIFLMPVVLTRLPADHFVRTSSRPEIPKTVGRLFLFVLRNTAGALLVLLGLALLVLPGQGILTIIVGVMLLDLPRKRAFVLRLIGRPRVLRAINGLRARAGRAPLEIPHRD